MYIKKNNKNILLLNNHLKSKLSLLNKNKINKINNLNSK